MKKDYKRIKSILWTILFINFGVSILKFIIGVAIRSASLVSDAYHSMGDGASNIVGIIGLELASRSTGKEDKLYPYGRAKFEIISGLFIGAMLLILGVKVVLSGMVSLANPVPPRISNISLIALVLTTVINIFVARYEYNAGKKLDSYVLVSDSIHTKTDIFISLGVLVTLIGVKLGLPPILDGIASLVVSGFILHAACEIFQSTIDVLVDKAVVDESDIVKVLKEFDEVKTFHKIRSRGNESNIYVDMHVMVDGEMNVQEAHKLSHDIEDRIREITHKNTQVIVHIEPYYEKKNI